MFVYLKFKLLQMKKILLLGILVIGSVMINKASAQVEFNANIGIEAQPDWGPSGYDNAQYYYLPDIEAYYCVPTREFTWFENGQWVTSPYLPQCYANYDLYSGYKIVLNERNPWFRFNEHRRIYAPYRFRHDQVIIRDSRPRGYYGGVNYGRSNYGYNNSGRVYNYGRTYEHANNYDHANYDNRSYDRRVEDNRNRGGGDRGWNRGNDRGHDQRSNDHGNGR